MDARITHDGSLKNIGFTRRPRGLGTEAATLATAAETLATYAATLATTAETLATAGDLPICAGRTFAAMPAAIVRLHFQRTCP